MTVLAGIARKRASDIASVATHAVLDWPQVAAAVVGATSAAHLPAHARIDALHLETEDWAAIASVTDRRRGPKGDVYELERDRTGRHGAIMKYNSNTLASGGAADVVRA